MMVKTSSSVVPLKDPGTNNPSLRSPRAATSCLSNRQRCRKGRGGDAHESLNVLVARSRANDLESGELHLQYEMVDLLALFCELASVPEGDAARDVRGVVVVLCAGVDEEERARGGSGEGSRVVDVVEGSSRRSSGDDGRVGLPFGSAKEGRLAMRSGKRGETHPFRRQYPVNVASPSFSSVTSPVAIALMSSSCAALVISLALRIHSISPASLFLLAS